MTSEVAADAWNLPVLADRCLCDLEAVVLRVVAANRDNPDWCASRLFLMLVGSVSSGSSGAIPGSGLIIERPEAIPAVLTRVWRLLPPCRHARGAPASKCKVWWIR